jgi:hypothetical protein
MKKSILKKGVMKKIEMLFHFNTYFINTHCVSVSNNLFTKMTTMTTLKECPICMDNILVEQNCTITECGHSFHTSCLMKSVAHIGFGCPYCRTVMAPNVENVENIYDEADQIEDELYEDFLLRGFRFFTNNHVLQQTHSEEDIQDEEDHNEEEEEEANHQVKPPIEIITQMLVDQIPVESMIKAFLSFHVEYAENDEVLERCEAEIFGKIRHIISQFQRNQ